MLDVLSTLTETFLRADESLLENKDPIVCVEGPAERTVDGVLDSIKNKLVDVLRARVVVVLNRVSHNGTATPHNRGLGRVEKSWWRPEWSSSEQIKNLYRRALSNDTILEPMVVQEMEPTAMLYQNYKEFAIHQLGEELPFDEQLFRARWHQLGGAHEIHNMNQKRKCAVEILRHSFWDPMLRAFFGERENKECTSLLEVLEKFLYEKTLPKEIVDNKAENVLAKAADLSIHEKMFKASKLRLKENLNYKFRLEYFASDVFMRESARIGAFEEKTVGQALADIYVVLARNDLAWLIPHPGIATLTRTQGHTKSKEERELDNTDVFVKNGEHVLTWVPHCHDFDGINVRTTTLKGVPFGVAFLEKVGFALGGGKDWLQWGPRLDFGGWWTPEFLSREWLSHFHVRVGKYECGQILVNVGKSLTTGKIYPRISVPEDPMCTEEITVLEHNAAPFLGISPGGAIALEKTPNPEVILIRADDMLEGKASFKFNCGGYRVMEIMDWGNLVITSLSQSEEENRAMLTEGMQIMEESRFINDTRPARNNLTWPAPTGFEESTGGEGKWCRGWDVHESYVQSFPFEAKLRDGTVESWTALNPHDPRACVFDEQTCKRNGYNNLGILKGCIY